MTNSCHISIDTISHELHLVKRRLMMQLEKNLVYYSEQGLVSSPGEYVTLLGELPVDIRQLCASIHQLMLIDFLPNMGFVNVPSKHLEDVQIRDIKNRLKKIVDRDNSSILTKRSFEKITLGNCRDLCLMLCSVLRHHHIPARLRSGFGTFFVPQKYHDHWVCEYWSQSESRWIRVDPWMSQIHYRKELLPPQLSEGLLQLDLNPYDVQKEYFITGAEAWINCREKGHDSNNYGTYEPHLKGLWFVRDNMIRDLLCLNKIEPLAWDCWGAMGREISSIDEDKLILLDDIAAYLVKPKLIPAFLSKKLAGLKIHDAVLKSLA